MQRDAAPASMQRNGLILFFLMPTSRPPMVGVGLGLCRRARLQLTRLRCTNAGAAPRCRGFRTEAARTTINRRANNSSPNFLYPCSVVGLDGVCTRARQYIRIGGTTTFTVSIRMSHLLFGHLSQQLHQRAVLQHHPINNRIEHGIHRPPHSGAQALDKPLNRSGGSRGRPELARLDERHEIGRLVLDPPAALPLYIGAIRIQHLQGLGEHRKRVEQ